MMASWARWLTSVALVLALGVLLVPLAVLLVPPVVGSLRPSTPQPSPEIPGIQRPPEEVREPHVVGALSADAPAPLPDLLGPLLDAELALEGATVTGMVLDVATDDVLYEADAGRAQPPASNIKLLTAAAVMAMLPPERRFDTTVLAEAADGALYLQGHGDVLLGAGQSLGNKVVGHAGLATLAEETVAALDPAAGPFTVYVDDSHFEGAALNPTWADGDVLAGEISAIYPLALTSGWSDEEARERYPDAAIAAAQVFQSALTAAGADRGLDILPAVERRTATAEAQPIASVESATVEQQVTHMLEVSDNYVAEALARSAAQASGRPASFGGATETLTAVAAHLGVPLEGLEIGDASGLSGRNAISAEQFARLLGALALAEKPGLTGILDALPVAGLTGTLEERFDAESGPARTGAGVVRAKTGTLNAVTTLSGYVVSRDGRLLAFSFMASGLDGDTAAARKAADNAAGVLAACGCR